LVFAASKTRFHSLLFLPFIEKQPTLIKVNLKICSKLLSNDRCRNGFYSHWKRKTIYFSRFFHPVRQGRLPDRKMSLFNQPQQLDNAANINNRNQL